MSKRASVHKWSDNVVVLRLGRALEQAMRLPYGDSIDRGLALLQTLGEESFEVTDLSKGDVVISAEDMAETIRCLTTYEESCCIGAATRKRVQALLARLTEGRV